MTKTCHLNHTFQSSLKYSHKQLVSGLVFILSEVLKIEAVTATWNEVSLNDNFHHCRFQSQFLHFNWQNFPAELFILHLQNRHDEKLARSVVEDVLVSLGQRSFCAAVGALAPPRDSGGNIKTNNNQQ